MVKKVSKQSVAKPVAKEEVAEKDTREFIKAMDFVPVWHGAETAGEVAEHFGRDTVWACAFAARLRKMGVKLKKMEKRSGRQRIDVDELNALIGE